MHYAAFRLPRILLPKLSKKSELPQYEGFSSLESGQRGLISLPNTSDFYPSGATNRLFRQFLSTPVNSNCLLCQVGSSGFDHSSTPSSTLSRMPSGAFGCSS